jgi:hypothetical protein
MKCLGSRANGLACNRVRVFSFLQLSDSQPSAGAIPPVPLSEVPPALPNYPIIAQLAERGGYRREIAEFLTYACDLDMIGQLEPDPDSRDAAYRGAAVFLRVAAELFVARCILRRKRFTRKGRKVWGSTSQMLKIIRESGAPTLGKDGDRDELADELQYVFDLGNVAAHSRLDDPRLGRLKDEFPATHGTVNKALSSFSGVANRVRWQR